MKLPPDLIEMNRLAHESWKNGEIEAVRKFIASLPTPEQLDRPLSLPLKDRRPPNEST